MAKRLFDIICSLIGLILTSPVLATAAIAVRLDSPGPILFRQRRVGLNGRTFLIHKFRTMSTAPEQGEAAQITVGADPRITRVGRFLRHYKLDELPQLYDVLRGEMSLVGPRPEVPKYVEHYPAEIREQVLSIRPGITDRSSILFRNESDLLAKEADPEAYYVQHILPVKLGHHLEYVRSASVWEDVKIIVATLRAIRSSPAP